MENGTPQIVQTDQGRNFMSKEVEDFLKLKGIRHVTSTRYHPQTQGLVERNNQTINERVRLFCKNILEWDKHLAELIHSINVSVNKTTKQTPFLLLRGYEPRCQIDNHFKTINIDI